MTPPRSNVISRALLVVLLSAPALFLFFLIRHFAVNLVCADDWFDAANLIHQSLSGTLSWAAVFAQYHDHRIVLPRLMTLILWKLGGRLRNLPAMETDLAIMASAEFFLVWKLSSAKSASKLRISLWQAAPISFWIFSPYLFPLLQAGSYTSFQWTLMILGILAALACLDASSGIDALFWLAAAAGLAASFSNAAGLMVWPAGLVLLLLSNWKKERSAKRQILAWLFFGAAVWAAYFHGWNPSQQFYVGGAQRGLSYAFLHPFRAVRYVISYWGIPFSMAFSPFGTAALVSSAWFFTRAFKQNILWRNRFWVSLWIFVLAVSLETAVGRAWEPGGAGGRAGAFYLVAILGLLSVYALALDVFPRRRAALAWGFGLLSLLPYRAAARDWKPNQYLFRTMSYALRTYRSQSDLGLNQAWVFWDGKPDIVRQLAPMLEKNRWNVFAEPPPAGPALGPSLGRATLCGIDAINEAPAPAMPAAAKVAAGEGVALKGWAIDEPRHRAAAGVYIVVDGHWPVLASYGDRRRDVARKTGAPEATYSGWIASFVPEQLGLKPGRNSLSVETIASNGSGHYDNENVASFVLEAASKP